jgi:hypothetical protein
MAPAGFRHPRRRVGVRPKPENLFMTTPRSTGDTPPSDAPARGATTAQLRHAIDTGRTGSKVGAPDPAAAPLGTDDEAGGAPPDPELVARVMERETASAGAHPQPARPRGTPPG